MGTAPARIIGLTMHSRRLTCRALAAAPLTLLVGLAGPARAALDLGEKAPNFTLDAALAGKAFRFTLADALKNGPVVLYFFPAAFSTDCTIEAHAFAEASDEFKALGTTVIGVSHDELDTLKRFSTTECRNKFAVGADVDQKVMKAYDAVLSVKPDFANRVSYLIEPSGRIAYQFTSLNPHRHVSNVMNALKIWLAKKS